MSGPDRSSACPPRPPLCPRAHLDWACRMRRLTSASAVCLLLSACAITSPPVAPGAIDRFMERRGELVYVDTVQIAEGVKEVRLRSTSGLDFLARVTIPRPSTAPGPGAVLTGGFDTGRRAANLVPEGASAVVISPEYPEIALETEALADLERVRQLSLEHVARLLLCLEYLVSREDVDPDRLAIIGVSFGGFYAPAAAASDTRFQNVALMYAGADLSLLAGLQLEEEIPAPAATLVGEILALHLNPIEPIRWIGRIAPRPILFVNGLDDERIPRRSVTRLQRAAGSPIDRVWLPTGHLEPGARGLAQELVDTAFARLPVLGGTWQGERPGEPTGDRAYERSTERHRQVEQPSEPYDWARERSERRPPPKGR